jgi:hypothetical protein
MGPVLAEEVKITPTMKASIASTVSAANADAGVVEYWNNGIFYFSIIPFDVER